MSNAEGCQGNNNAWETWLQWPLEKNPEGGWPIMIRIQVTGRLTSDGFDRLQQFIELWRSAWLPEGEQAEALQHPQGTEDESAHE